MQSLRNYYGELVFTKKVMEQRLSKNIYKKLRAVIDNLEPLDQSIAGEVAHAMKEWALENGATHFTHWFQPQRGGTAQKHDSFIDYGDGVEVVERFSASQLVQSEPDASSFPSGGIRSTFEARGYTAWDPTSPVFLLDAGKTKTLVIPSVFLSWTGEVLDLKTPLLRSLTILNEKVIALQKLLGNKNAKHMKIFAGIEQEYFLLSKDIIKSRPDIIITGRTLFGNKPVKGQQMEDHYFGNIKENILEFMKDVDHELYRKGIPVKTRHNEVAPNQFELATLYQEENLAIDNNLQIMEVLKKVASKHNMVAILHEKPFAGINGSGKHFNWSISDNTGTNYFEPSKSPLKNISFLLAISAVLLGVKKFERILRASVADAGNDYRLGANEAPPAIMSVYLGEFVDDLLNSIERASDINEKKVNEITLGVQNLPRVNKDYSDRNRTSPIAFTGNKFEFRALGSSANPAEVGTTLNLVLTYGFDEIYKRIESRKDDSSDVKKKALEVVKEIILETKSVRFEKNGYSQDWHKEAMKRGLSNAKNTPEALKFFITDDVIKLFSKYRVLTERELRSKVEIKLENYVKVKEIEYKYAIKIVNTLLMPAVFKQINLLSKANKNLNDIDIKSESFFNELKTLIKIYDDIRKYCTDLGNFLAMYHGDIVAIADKFASDGMEILANLREKVDAAEDLVAAEFWPMEDYQKLLGPF